MKMIYVKTDRIEQGVNVWVCAGKYDPNDIIDTEYVEMLKYDEIEYVIE